MIDYKTGRMPAISDERGLSLQLPVYLMALDQENIIAMLLRECPGIVTFRRPGRSGSARCSATLALLGAPGRQEGAILISPK